MTRRPDRSARCLAAALASDTFNDVPTSNIFHDDIKWMQDNGITFGCNPPDNDEYCPDDNVTREQMAAFMHRLADNLIVPDPVEVATIGAPSFTSSTSFVDLPDATVDITVPEGHTALVVAELTAESRCTSTESNEFWCSIRILADGAEMDPQVTTNGVAQDFAFDSTDNGTDTSGSWDAHSATRSLELGPGTHTIKVQWSVTDSRVNFRMDDVHLLVTGHLQ